MAHYDALIIGAGFAGAVTARRLAEDGGKRVLVLERRGHIGGNAYDCPNRAGVLVHRYGPHIFHTNDQRVYQYLSRFTSWLDYPHKVVANIPNGTGGRVLFPVPFNLVSLEVVFGPQEGKRLGDKLIAAYGAEKKVTILELRQNPDPEISALADYVYEHVFVHYTMKQWGTTPEQIDPNTTARVPVFLSRDCRYFQDAYQGMPLSGYTPLFQQMLEHPNVEVRLNVDASDLLDLRGNEILFEEQPFSGPVVYTGAADELFGCVFGRLPYRTLDFQFETLPTDCFQTNGTVNYTVDEDFTRITEFKKLTGQTLPGRTVILREYPAKYQPNTGMEAYYPIDSEESHALYQRYREEFARYGNLYFCGRLAEYRYYNMDAAVDAALRLSAELVK